MITAILIGILFMAELFFLLWNLKEKAKHDREKMVTRLLGVVVLLLLLFAGILEGISRYGLLICLLLLQSLAAFLFLRRERHSSSKSEESLPGGRPAREKSQHAPVRRFGAFVGNLLLYTLALFPAILFPQYSEPRVTGDHEVLVCEYTWVDESRIETYSDTGENRSVTVKFWYPKEPGTYPLVVFSHGAFGMIDSNYSTCMELASNGYVAASVAHPYHAMFVQDVYGNTTPVSMEFLNQVMAANGSDDPEHEQDFYEISQDWLAVRTGDMNFVLDTVLANAAAGEDGPFSRIDPDKIGLFGHSLGGATAVMTGRQRDDIDAVIDLEGTMLGEYTGYENNGYLFRQEPYPIPVLDVNSKAVYEAANSYEGWEYVNFYVGKHARDFREVTFKDAAHLNFTDLPMVSPILARMLGTGEVDAKVCMEHVNEMVLHYFNYYLKDAPELDIREEY